MFCIKCGNQVTEGKAFCRHCGAKIVETKVPTQDEINLISETQESSNQDIQSLDAKKFKNLIKVWLIGASIINLLMALANVFLEYIIYYALLYFSGEDRFIETAAAVSLMSFIIIPCRIFLVILRGFSIFFDIKTTRQLLMYKKKGLTSLNKRNILVITRRFICTFPTIAFYSELMFALGNAGLEGSSVWLLLYFMIFSIIEFRISENYLKKRKHLFVN